MYSRETKLDNIHMIQHISVPSHILYLSIVDNALLVYCADNMMYHYLMTPSSSSSSSTLHSSLTPTPGNRQCDSNNSNDNYGGVVGGVNGIGGNGVGGSGGGGGLKSLHIELCQQISFAGVINSPTRVRSISWFQPKLHSKQHPSNYLIVQLLPLFHKLLF